jgi:hypothetical protein
MGSERRTIGSWQLAPRSAGPPGRSRLSCRMARQGRRGADRGVISSQRALPPAGGAGRRSRTEGAFRKWRCSFPSLIPDAPSVPQRMLRDTSPGYRRERARFDKSGNLAFVCSLPRSGGDAESSRQGGRVRAWWPLFSSLRSDPLPRRRRWEKSYASRARTRNEAIWSRRTASAGQ